MSNTDNNVQKIGKFRYIEPNDVLEHEMYPERAEGARSYNITHPYEDYSIDVELEVKIPRRGIWPNSFHDTTTSNANSKVGTESFFGGTNGFLTDTPGSMIYKDILNNQADRESLGITHIHIAYNSYFVPEITINFTDIRGMGLFMSHEEDYRLHRQTQGTVGVEKFFAALFTFPYPEFTLKVKGFYGKKVSYSLVVSDFKSSFNNQTGNFDATVKFIGKMYGVYTDIPMTYLLIAPYCKYGMGENETVWSTCNFKWENGTSMPTFIQLKRLILGANEQLRSINSGAFLDGHQSVFIKKQLLHEVSTAYNNFTQHMTSFTNIISDGQKIFLCPGEGTGYRTTFPYLYPDNGSTRGVLINLTQTLYDKISAYNATVTNNDKLPFIIPLTSRTAKIDNRNAFVHVNINQGQIDGDLQFDNDYEISFQLSNYNGIKSQLQRLSNGKHSFFVVNSEDFVRKLIQLEEANNAALNDAKTQIIDKIHEYYEEKLGFAPTIKNIFMLVLAHLQAFLTVFQKCINNINTNTNRTIQSNNLNSSLLPDIPLWVTGDSHLPPFPALKNNATNTFVYPTEINNANLEEDNFINHLFAGASDTIAENEIVDAHGDNADEVQQLFIPTCITDFHCYGNAHPNPYYYTFMDNNNIQTLDWIFTFFGYRCAQKFLLEHSQNPGVTDATALYHNGFRDGDILLTDEEFGQYEAFNFWLAHPILSQNIYDALNNNSNINADNFVNFIANSFTFDGVSSAPTTWEDKFIAEQNSSYLQVFNLDSNTGYPARLCHGEQYNAQYTSDKTNFGYSFLRGRCDKQEWTKSVNIKGYPNGTNELMPYDSNGTDVATQTGQCYYENKPYKLIKSIEISQLNNWQKALNTINHSAITCDKYKNIIQQYIDNSYYSRYYKFNNPNDYTTFQNYANNPAYNVLFQTGTVGSFFEKHSHENSFYKHYLNNNGNLHPCNYITDNHGSDVMVYSMHGRLGDAFISAEYEGYYLVERSNSQIPLFFIPNLTAGDFLCNIPHNIEGLALILRDGRRIIKMPYVTKLFIGYIIDVIQNKDFKELQALFLKILDQAKATCNDNYNIGAQYRNGTELQSSYISAIYVILSYLTCDNNKNFNGLMDSWKPDDAESNNTNKAICNTIIHGGISVGTLRTFYIVAKSGLFSQDIFRFADEYRLWRDNTSASFKIISDGNGSTINIPGFMWIKNNMCLKENEDSKLTIGDIEIKLTKTTPFDRLIELITNGQVQDWLSRLSTNGRSLTEIATSDENPLNRYYKHYDNSEESQSTSAFGDIYCSIQYTDTTNIDDGNVNLQFNPEWRGTQLLNNLLKDVSYLIYPYSRNPKYANQNLKASKNLFINAFNSFKETLKSLCTSDNPEANVTVSNVNSIIPLEQKLSMYRTLKNLYDKHFTNIDSELDKYRIMGNDNSINENGEMGKFHFIDTYYEDLGDKLLINPDTLIELINTAMDTYGNGGDEISSDLSLYSFLSLICQKHNMLLISMPIFNGSIQGDEGSSNFANMFKPLPKKDCEELEGPSYICFYPHQASQHLDIPISQYRNDGFLITDVNDTQNFEGPTTITGLKESGKYTIPAFGVEYGTQKQSIFTNINVNMDNPQVTEASVAVQFGIANDKNTNTRRKTTDGQDLFKIYSNYSYTCQVEMMGCAQVQPLMYFQLNNIPMFRGAYQIINVEHDITPGNMTTSFKGVRINKTNIPMTSQLITFNLEDIASVFQEQLNVQAYPVITLRDFNVSHIDSLDGAHSRDWVSSTVSLNNLTGNFSDVKSYLSFEGGQDNFNELNPSLRQLIYCILKDIKDINDQNILDYTLGINITSTVRRSNNSSSHSDHEIADGTNRCSPKAERENIRGEAIRVTDGLGDGLKKYSQMGCAIDFCATKNGTKDKGEPSILLFYHILKTYYPYIKQLIWEVDTGLSKQENISHIIHLSSYGKATSQMKCQVFMAENFGQTTIRGRENWSENFTNVWNRVSPNDLIENLSENSATTT